MSDIENKKEIIDTMLTQARNKRRKAPEETISLATRALEIAKEIESDEHIADAYQWMGIGHFNISSYEKSLKYNLKSMELNERLGRTKHFASNLSNIGLQYEVLDDFNSAEYYYNKAHDIYKELGYTLGLAGIYSKMGNLMVGRGDLEQGIAYHQQALELRRQQGNDMGIALACHNIGHIERQLGKFNSAMENLQTALKIREDIDDNRGIAITATEIARILIVREQWADALAKALIAHNIAKDCGLREELMHSWELLSNIQAGMGQFEEALHSHRQFSQLQHEIYASQLLMRISELQTRWTSEKQQREIDILRKDNEILELERRNIALALAVTASHEMNQPLMVLQGNLEMLLSTITAVDGRQKRYMARIDASQKRIRNVLRKFRTASDIQFEPYSESSPMIVFADNEESNP
ncbi:MAG: tetratricopeptide repeat protein [Candidatus Cloacimonetes bacterium]|nr:tetratricopeptide repeat protein [Candidatus Cloacimonadota bacterium]